MIRKERNTGKQHPIVRINYIPRLVGGTFVFFIMATILYGRKTDPLIWLPVSFCLAWPHLALWLASRKHPSKIIEIRNMYVDAFFFGFFIPIAHFQLWVAFTFLNILFSNTLRVGGVLLLVKASMVSVLGALAGIALEGFQIDISSGWATIILCALMTSVYFSLFGQYSYTMTRELIQSKKHLEKAMAASEEANNKTNAYLHQMQSANQSLQASLKNLEIAKTQLVQSEKMAALGGLVAGVAHEINTPLGIGITAASLLEHRVREQRAHWENGEKNPAAVEKFYAFAAETADIMMINLQRVADQVRSFKQVAVDQTSQECRRIQVKTYIDDILFSLRPQFKSSRHAVTLNCADDIRFHTYPGVFSQLITNLVMNSLIHGFEGIPDGRICINIWQEGRHLILYYTDNGKGMDRETLDKMFDPFFTTKRSRGGTGLGMHILYNLVTQSLGGELECTSTPDEGVVFLIRIPEKLPPQPIPASRT
ncbi:MAG: ATP-binding protein [Thermodesulfobacteriota bacterium]